MKVFVACSAHFYHRVKEFVDILSGFGHEVGYPNSFEEPFIEDRIKKNSIQEYIDWSAKIMREDRDNLKKYDAILVLNFEKNGKANYIGASTFLEIYNAWCMRKKIFFYNPSPDCIFTSELIGINPVIINGDLELIK